MKTINDYARVTVDYYDHNSEQYEKKADSVDFSEISDSFLKYLKKGSLILDFGCGTGRDSKYFIHKGYKVYPVDGSTEMCKRASMLLGQEVVNMYFNEFKEINKFDGIWACSSVLHLPTNELISTLKNLEKSLKNGGYIYLTFKYGEYEGYRNGRFFNDMTEDKFKKILMQISNISIMETFYNTSTIKEQINKQWINFFLKKSIEE